MEASKIMRDIQPVQWQLLDTPQDGTMLLTWQPMDYLGTNFASDGYVWADAEQAYKSDVRGYVSIPDLRDCCAKFVSDPRDVSSPSWVSPGRASRYAQ